MKQELEPSTAVIPAPVVLLSVKSGDSSNIITLSWIANICSDPPTVAVGIRPSRYSYELLKKAHDFVLNIPSSDQLESVIFCGTKSGRDYDKFRECRFTEFPSTKVGSPMIKECPVNIECTITNILHLGAHDLFIAKVVAVHIDDDLLTGEGHLDVSLAKLFTYIPLSGEYWSLGSKMN
ncbi:MAG: flavin reductase family protein [Candidatus Thorarchaeota archaeon]|nr:flavin reductase family protein [Candidatus Thorarchaeota archaeon]